jgi:uncharacterized membrane protein YfcA
LLIVASLVGGFLVACAGIGGGLIFNPFLLVIDLPPAVAAATGMYLSLFTTGVATMVNCISLNMPFTYMGTLFVFTVIGTFPGLFGQTWLVIKTKRPSATVFVLLIVIAYCIIAQALISLITSLNLDPANRSFLFDTSVYCPAIVL